MAIPSARQIPFATRAGLGGVAVFASLLWCYWSSLAESVDRWTHDDLYSHGYLVPAFAAVLLWLRRGRFDAAALRPSWWGVPVLAGALAAHLAGGFYHFQWLDAVSLVPAVAGAVLLLGGPAAWRWAWPAVAFLVFMIPLPYTAGVALADPLRRLGTVTSTFALQTLGLPALAEGNRILLNEESLDVARACSGLRMLFTFVALAVGMTLVIRRPLWEKAVIVAGAVPIAVAANVVRITATGVLYEWFGRQPVEDLCHAVTRLSWHDLSGYLMMPLALLMLAAVLKILAHLFREPTRADVVRPRLAPVPA